MPFYLVHEPVIKWTLYVVEAKNATEASRTYPKEPDNYLGYYYSGYGDFEVDVTGPFASREEALREASVHKPH